MTLDSAQCRMSSLTWRISAESLVFPGQHHTRTGIPSRVTAMPITTGGRSLRYSLELPKARNPAALPSPAPPPACWPPAALPGWSRATGASACSAWKQAEAVPENSRSTSRPSASAARPQISSSRALLISSSQSIARQHASSVVAASPPTRTCSVTHRAGQLGRGSQRPVRD
jgi:hypothetical protein